MNFNHTTFISQLDAYSGIDTSDDGWEQWSGTAGDLNMKLDFSKDDCDYRVWYPEVTIMHEQAGMLVSCKVDFKRATGDDHIIVLTGYSLSNSNEGNSGTKTIPVFAKASVQFHGSSDNNVAGSPVQLGGDNYVAAGNDFGQAVYDSLNASIDDADFGNVDDSTECRKRMPDIARAIVNSMIGAAS